MNKIIAQGSMDCLSHGEDTPVKKVQNAGLSGTYGSKSPLFDAKKLEPLPKVDEMLKAADLKKADFLSASRIQLAMMACQIDGLSQDSFMLLTRNLLIAVESIYNMTPSRKAWERVNTIMNSWKAYYNEWDFKANPTIDLPNGLIEGFEWLYDYFEQHMFDLNQTRFALAIVDVDKKLAGVGIAKDSQLSKKAQTILTAAIGLSAGNMFN